MLTLILQLCSTKQSTTYPETHTMDILIKVNWPGRIAICVNENVYRKYSHLWSHHQFWWAIPLTSSLDSSLAFYLLSCFFFCRSDYKIDRNFSRSLEFLFGCRSLWWNWVTWHRYKKSSHTQCAPSYTWTAKPIELERPARTNSFFEKCSSSTNVIARRFTKPSPKRTAVKKKNVRQL